MNDPNPINVSAMILCDGVAIDTVTGKTTIVGCSSGFRVPELPATLPAFAVYILFSEVTKRIRLDLKIVTEEDDIIYELPPTMVEPIDPLNALEFDPRFAGVNIERAGDYFVRLLADSVYIMDVRFTVWLNDEDE